MKQGAEVVAAGNSVQVRLLEKEFPQIAYQHLGGYNVHYAVKKNRFMINLMKQAPGILKIIRQENDWLKDMVKQHGVQGVISDNRFGLYHAGIPTVFITHQLRLRTSLGGRMERLLQRINYRWINKFSRCWIPDHPQAPGLAGDLSHPEVLPAIPCAYLGPLSRMHLLNENTVREGVLILLSGPEPQRSLFEKIVCDQLRSLKERVILVRGLPGGGGPPLPDLGPVPVYDHLPAEALNRLMCRAAYIVCRSGYSSLMDLQATGAKPILVPTPGQTEQEYLAALLGHQRRAVISSQAAFDLEALLNKAKEIKGAAPVYHGNGALAQAVAGFLTDCSVAAPVVKDGAV
ncbi:glycosyltransferase [Niabella aurantiaca]|uniref:glycosyltransferase n=1 Tax=Niabella aurantiaca TaxID=379900 RepID=UPI001FE1739A|nr:glycosyltransferase [Niabella aurantiaca]